MKPPLSNKPPPLLFRGRKLYNKPPSQFQPTPNKPFPSSPGPLFQNEVLSLSGDVEIIFHSHANKTRFHKKGCALSLILKVRVFGTRTWLVILH